LTEEFSETDHWKLLAATKRFLTGADVLRRSAEYQSSRVLFTPILHLTAHGIEVLLKANLVGAGLPLDEVRKKYGHDIAALWAHGLNRLLRDEAASEARKVWQAAQADGRWQDRFDDDPVKLLEIYRCHQRAPHGLVRIRLAICRCIRGGRATNAPFDRDVLADFRSLRATAPCLSSNRWRRLNIRDQWSDARERDECKVSSRDGRCPSGRSLGCAGTTPAARFRHSASIANAKSGGGHFANSPALDEAPWIAPA
jgi:hypothetical protein